MQNTKPNKTQNLLYEKESYLIRGACFTVYKTLWSAQKEVIYQRALAEELQILGLEVEREKRLPVKYRDKQVGVYTPDILVNQAIILELKAKPFLHKEDLQQFWYYLKNSGYKLGFLINFGEPKGVTIMRRVYDEARLHHSA